MLWPAETGGASVARRKLAIGWLFWRKLALEEMWLLSVAVMK